MSGRKMGGALAAIVVAVLVAALVDGGEEPLRPIEQTVELPEAAR
ncbi:hypothetical protein [Qipengyuania sp.]